MRTRWSTRLHSATGVLPLLAFVVLHLWETMAATGGRERFVLEMTGLHGGAAVVALEIGLVVVPLLAHAMLGLVRARVDDRGGAGTHDDVGSRRLQWITGALVLLFVGVHLVHAWVPKVAGAGPFAGYAALRTDLPHPLHLTLYVVGLTALCLHVAQGLPAFARTWSLAPGVRALRAWRWGAGALAVALWLVAINTTSHFATGRALVPLADPVDLAGETNDTGRAP